MKKIRDSQRSKLYTWERDELKTAWLVIDKDNTPLGETGAQSLVNLAWDEFVGLIGGDRPTVKVAGNRGRGAARWSLILLSSLYLTSQTTWYVLHELAHVIQMRMEIQIAWHGPEFCDLYARLLDKYTAANYKHVIESMKESGLKLPG